MNCLTKFLVVFLAFGMYFYMTNAFILKLILEKARCTSDDECYTKLDCHNGFPNCVGNKCTCDAKFLGI
ncbi:hypothetical protein FQR65_LT09357 [Abscondita terminalis]|nr:hypothetical protein FQR65_LT09357 [Abscondita terminalis]